MDITARLAPPMPPREAASAAEPAAVPSRRPVASRVPGALPPLSPPARWVFIVLASLFVLAVAFRLNGSSCGMYRNQHWHDIRTADSPSGLLLSAPKLNRADEWQVWTPAILSQARQQPVAFPTTNPALGPGHTPLLMSLPVRHYTTILRPQFWGYFFLPLDAAFSWHWQCKVFGLFAGMFLLFWTLTDGRLGPSLFGAAMVEFSPFVQWWFSSPSMLPEMLASWAVAVVAAMSLLGPQRPPWRLCSLAALFVGGTNFFLCCYVGFEMPLLFLGVFLLAGYACQQRLRPWPGVGWLAGAACLIAAWLTPWFLACLPELRTVAHTVYPGQRVCTGGHLSLLWYFSAFYDFALTDFNCPPALGNVCEAANFYPLWLLPVGLGAWSCCRVLRRRPRILPAWLAARGVPVAAGAYLAGMTLFCFVPFPRWFCDLTLLTHSQEARCTVGIGLAGMCLLVLSLCRRHHRPFSIVTAVAAGAWALAVLSFLLWERSSLGSLQSPARLLGAWAIAAGFGAAYLFAPASWFQGVTASVFCLTMATVNPLCAGLPELLASPALARVQRWIAADPAAAWVTYDSLFGSELIRACGAHIITGERTIPDFSILRALDPAGRDDSSYNRYSSLIFSPDNTRPEPVVELYNMVYCKVRITPAQMAGRFPAVRFVAVPHPLPLLEAVGFRLIDSIPADRLWLYHKGPLAASAPAPTP